MKRAILAGLLLAAAPLSAVVAQNWNVTFEETERGHRVGNPEAGVKLIAFVSYSCPHCANFETQSDAALRAGYIHSGKVSVEVRHVIRNPLDLAAALATECGPEDRFWANHRAMMRAQPEWLEIARKANPAQTQRWMSGPLPRRMRNIAADLDFYELMERRGYSVSELDQCLSNEAAARALAERAEADDAAFNIQGTPSFAVNGTVLDGVHNWPALRQALDSRVQ